MDILLIIMIPFVLWIISLYWLSRWTKFWAFFIFNFILLMGYTAFLSISKLEIIGTDPYGLRRLIFIAIVIIGHIISEFIFALLKRKQI